jgi:hypothetical protein
VALKLILLLAGFAFSGDAAAWGLQTHLYLAQQALPAAAPACAALVLAGACLPDLALAGRFLGTPAFRRTHQWSTLRRVAASPRSDEEQALATGYATHLLADVVAHNEFVPEHESRLVRIPHFTHALSEWAMDRHVGLVRPLEELLHEPIVAAFVARQFRCGDALARRALGWLAAAERRLRVARIPELCLRLLGPAGFDAYLGKAAGNLRHLDTALQGQLRDWVNSDPEGRAGNRGADRRAGQHVARVVQAQHHP